MIAESRWHFAIRTARREAEGHIERALAFAAWLGPSSEVENYYRANQAGLLALRRDVAGLAKFYRTVQEQGTTSFFDATLANSFASPNSRPATRRRRSMCWRPG